MKKNRHIVFESWNLITGCKTISDGCRNCWAAKQTLRLQTSKLKKYIKGFDVIVEHEQIMNLPYSWKKKRRVWVCNMSDMFLSEVSDSFREKIIKVISNTKHKYFILTKRPENMRSFFRDRKLPKNLWLGVTVERNKHLDRIEILRQIDTRNRFVAFEPLLERIEPDLSGIGWVICGGETGAYAREFQPNWAKTIKDIAKLSNIPFYYTGRYGYKNRIDKTIDGKRWFECV